LRLPISPYPAQAEACATLLIVHMLDRRAVDCHVAPPFTGARRAFAENRGKSASRIRSLDAGETRMNEYRHPRSVPGMVAALIIITVGVILLLDRMGIIDGGDLFKFWPMLLVAGGLSHLLRPDEGGKVGGALMVAVGVLFQLKNLGIIRLDWSTAWPILIIAVGAALLWRALSGPSLTRATRDAFNESVVFGGAKLRSDTKDFRGGKLFAVFGGYEIDLTKADIAQDEVLLDVTAIFGGIEIRLPAHWRIVSKVTPILGGFEDKTDYPKADLPGGPKTLILQGLAMFGGIEVKN
jgi:predicted membrane protein